MARKARKPPGALPQDHSKARPGLKERLRDAVIDYFNNAEATVDCVPVRQLWFDLDVREVSASTRVEALGEALAELPTWERRARSVVRIWPAGAEW